jgi:hypothetical protein
VGVYQSTEIKFALVLLRLRADGPKDDATNTFLLLTLHWAKSLEFEHVFLPDWENRDFLPAHMTTRRNGRSRMSRSVAGMKCVTISHSALRMGPLRPSDFMKNIPDEHVSRVGFDNLSAFRARRVGRHHTATAPLAPHDQQRSDDERKYCFAGRV